MPVRVSCPECSQQYQLKDELAGKKVRCKTCEAVIPVPPAKGVAAKPKVQYDEVEFEDDEPDFEDLEWEERSAPRAKRPAKNQARSKKKRTRKSTRASALASLDEEQVTLYGSIGGGLYLLGLAAAAFMTGAGVVVQSLIGLVVMLIIGLIAAVILRLAVKLLIGGELPFGSAYLMEVVNGIATGGISNAMALLLFSVGFDPRTNLGLTVLLTFGTIFGVRAYIFGVCILDDVGDSIGFVKGVLITLLELVIYIGIGFIAAILVVSLGVAVFR